MCLSKERNAKIDLGAMVAGVDGCRSGWFCVTREPGSLEIGSRLFPDAASLLRQLPLPTVIGIDMPIGLTEAGRRACDVDARKVLGWPRSSSVFSAPIRPALRATSHAEATRITRRRDGRGVAAQAWGIYRKVRELDMALTRDASICARVFEVHPELSFHELNGGQSIVAGKRTPEGHRARRRLLGRQFGRGVFSSIRKSYAVNDVADDDILDAFAVLWSAERIARGIANVLPVPPPGDRKGIPMGIWY
ncbi:hypothetical protein Pan216_33790 [Planctomycetes bacterium Pan216]|uniref:DUF429 domain-containing protein n=1 Tax=Kolteria novifilia TaxID=2527975 RepID=A0A518B6F4_9BACT|nr:hypothetical protein Pan216_33790 [Planctomycetes bacterium Pan216]